MNDYYDSSKRSNQPDINLTKPRKAAVLRRGKAIFNIRSDNMLQGIKPAHELNHFEDVKRHNSVIEAKAKEYGVDPDLMRSIIYLETTPSQPEGFLLLST